MSKYESAKESLEKCIALNRNLGKKESFEENIKAENYITIIKDSINAYTICVNSIREERFREKEIQDSIDKAKRVTDEIRMVKLDSIKSSFINPKTLCNNIGFITKKNVENLYSLDAHTYYGGKVFYEIPMCSIGITYMGKTEVAAVISFRLFGEDGYTYLKQLYVNGFKEIGQVKTLNLEIDPDLSTQLINGKVIKLIKRDSKGKIICELLCGSYFGFEFYRTK